MRYLTIGLLLGMLAFFTSCEKENGNRNDDLDGTWQLVSLEGSGGSSFAIINGISMPVTFSMEGCDMDYTIRFDGEEGEFATDGTYGIKYTSNVMNDSTVHTVAHDDYQVTSDYMEASGELSSDRALLQFIIPSAIGEQTFDIKAATIVELTDEDLVLRHSETFSEQLPGGFLMSNVDVTTTWTKN